MDNSRIAYLDMMKGIGIFLVVLGHVSSIGVLHHWIYSFHMPLFFFLSGFAFHLSNKTEFIKRKASRVLIPYFLFSFLSFFYWVFIERFFRPADVSPISAFLSMFVANGENSPNIALWFLPCLFVTELVFCTVWKCYKSDIFLGTFLIFSSVIGFLLPNLIQIRLPWSLDTMFVAIVYYGIGYYLASRHMVLVNNLNKKSLYMIFFLILFFLFSIGCLFLNGPVDLNKAIYHNYFWFYFAALSGIFFTLLLSKTFTNKVVRYFGENTLLILCIHEPIKRVIIQLMSKFFHIEATFLRQDFIFCLITTVIIFMIFFPIIKLVNKEIPFLVGRNNSNKSKLFAN